MAVPIPTRRRHRATVYLGPVALLLTLLVLPAPASARIRGDLVPRAQSTQCPTSGGLSPAQVTVSRPSPGPVPSSFTVSGEARSILPLSRVEVVADGVVVASRSYPSSAVLVFEVPVEARRLRPGAVALRVVACGHIGQTATVASGSSAPFTVQVPAAAPTSTVAPPSTVASDEPTTTSSSTTSSSTTSTTRRTAAAAVGGRPRGDSGDASSGLTPFPVLTLDDERARGGGPVSRPLSVGITVGVAGAAGLIASTALRRRPRRRRRPGRPDLLPAR